MTTISLSSPCHTTAPEIPARRAAVRPSCLTQPPVLLRSRHRLARRSSRRAGTQRLAAGGEKRSHFLYLERLPQPGGMATDVSDHPDSVAHDLFQTHRTRHLLDRTGGGFTVATDQEALLRLAGVEFTEIRWRARGSLSHGAPVAVMQPQYLVIAAWTPLHPDEAAGRNTQ